MLGGTLIKMLRNYGVQGLSEGERAFIEANAATFDQTLPWFEEFENKIFPSKTGYVGISGRTGEEPIGLLATRQGHIKAAGQFGFRSVEALSNYYTALYAPVISPIASASALEFLAAQFRESARAVSVVDLNPLADDSPFLSVVIEAFRSAGWFTEVYPKFGNWYLPVQGIRYADYLASRPGQLRSTLSRKFKKFAALPDARTYVVTKPSDVDSAMDRYESIYRLSWKVDEPHNDFIRAIVKRFAQQGWLRLGLAEVGNEPAAAQLWFTYRGTASIFKLAYNPKFSELSIGSLLTAHLMKYSLDVDHVHTVDYLCGDDEYKKDWMTCRRQRVGFRATRTYSVAGGIEAVARTIKKLRG